MLVNNKIKRAITKERWGKASKRQESIGVGKTIMTHITDELETIPHRKPRKVKEAKYPIGFTTLVRVYNLYGYFEHYWWSLWDNINLCVNVNVIGHKKTKSGRLRHIVKDNNDIIFERNWICQSTD